MCKKIVSVLLVIVMLFSVAPVAVFAEAATITAEAGSDNIFVTFYKMFMEFINTIKSLFSSLFGGSEASADIPVKIVDGVTGREIAITGNDGFYYLYLPSDMNRDDLIFSFDGDATVKIDGTAIKAGEKTAALAGMDSILLSINGNTKYVEIVESANIPSLYITTESGKMDYVHANKENKEAGSLIIVDEKGNVEYADELDYIKGRGNTSWKYDKKGYNLKLAKSTDICGMGKTKKWSLIPNYIDKSILRNQIVYDLADAVGLEYSSANTPVDVYLNGAYNGTYLLVVKNEVGSAAVDITDLEKATEKVNDDDLDAYKNVEVYNKNGLAHYKYNDIPNNPEDITGGYLLELDHSSYSKEASGFTTARGQRVVIKAPEYASKAQVEYIGAWFQEFEDAVYSADGFNAKGKHYTEYIDDESFAKYYLISEITMNGDSHITSVFMYKESDVDGDGLLHAGPVWDYDTSLGNNGGVKDFYVKVTLTNPAQQFFSISKMYKGNGADFIYCAIYRHADFRSLVIDCYKNDVEPAFDMLLNGGSTEYGRLQRFDKYVSTIKPAAAMNFTRWNIMGRALTGTQTGTTYDANISNLKSFLTNKKAFLDKIIDAYSEDYLYIFVDGSNVYGVTSFTDYTAELYSGSATVGKTVSHGGKTFTVTSVK